MNENEMQSPGGLIDHGTSSQREREKDVEDASKAFQQPRFPDDESPYRSGSRSESKEDEDEPTTTSNQKGDEEKEAEFLLFDIPTPISTLYYKSVRSFNTLITATQDTPCAAEAQDLSSKLKVWAGNHGAHRNPLDRMSLDHRLREAPDLHREVRDHFTELNQAVEDAINACASPGLTLPLNESYYSSSDSEPSLTGSEKEMIHATVSQQPHGSDTRIQILIQSIHNIITSLYKFSITIQNPASRDRTARAAKIDVSFWDEADLRHIKDKFHKSADPKLLGNLAQANTKRRQLFAYHRRHIDKIRAFEESAAQVVEDVNQKQSKERLRKSLAAPTVHTSNTMGTKLTRTTLSTIKPFSKTVAVSISGRSQRTNVTNDPGSNQEDVLRIPPPPRDADQFDGPFICPYCFLTIEPRDTQDWEIHVLDDLRPYICTFGDCISAAILYERYTEWRTHELEVHRREWFCNFCKIISDTKDDFMEHLKENHASIVKGDDQFESLISLCERISTRDEDCPLCTEFTGNVHQLLPHLARHLRQAAIYTLPRIVDHSSQESEAQSNIANVRGPQEIRSDDTQAELLKMPKEDIEVLFQDGKAKNLAVSMNSWKEHSIPELNDPVSWDFCQQFGIIPDLEADEIERERLVNSFGVSKAPLAHGKAIDIVYPLATPTEEYSFNEELSVDKELEAVRAVTIQTELNVDKLSTEDNGVAKATTLPEAEGSGPSTFDPSLTTSPPSFTQTQLLPPTPESRIGLILENSLSLGAILGVSLSGTMYSAVDAVTGRWFTVKALSKFNAKGEPLNSRQLEFISREIRLHYSASAHPNIITLYKVIDNADCVYSIMEFCPDGDLFSNITEKGRYVNNDALARQAFLQILDAVEHCHRVGIYHRDIKPDNILVSNAGERVLLSEFCIATTDIVSEEHGCGSSFYMSPECLDKSSQNAYRCAPNDIWSLGVVLINLTCGRNPWKLASMEDPLYREFTKDRNFIKKILPISDELNEILGMIFERNPEERITIEKLRACILACPNFSAPIRDLPTLDSDHPPVTENPVEDSLSDNGSMSDKS